MYPDTTGNGFAGDAAPPHFQPVDLAGIPAQRSPWEPSVHQFNVDEPPAWAPSDPEPVYPADPASTYSVPAESDLRPVEPVEPVEPEPEAVAEVDEVVAPADQAVEPAAEAPQLAAEVPEPAAEVLEPAADKTPVAAPLRPGDVTETRIAAWPQADAEAFRVRIREAGNLFVDDPHVAVTATAAVVTDAVNGLAATLQRQHAELDPRQLSDNPDTESLRVAVRRYREFLERVLAL
jgi:hypothetical protein